MEGYPSGGYSHCRSALSAGLSWPGGGKVRKTPGGSGLSCTEPFAFFDRDTCSWRMSAVSLTGDCEEYSGKWPVSGMMRDGSAYALPMPERLIGVRESSSSPNLPTPCASNPNATEDLESWEARRQRNLAKHINGNGQGTPLGIAVRLLPTPGVRLAPGGPGTADDQERQARSRRESLLSVFLSGRL